MLSLIFINYLCVYLVAYIIPKQPLNTFECDYILSSNKGDQVE